MIRVVILIMIIAAFDVGTYVGFSIKENQTKSYNKDFFMDGVKCRSMLSGSSCEFLFDRTNKD